MNTFVHGHPIVTTLSTLSVSFFGTAKLLVLGSIFLIKFAVGCKCCLLLFIVLSIVTSLNCTFTQWAFNEALTSWSLAQHGNTKAGPSLTPSSHITAITISGIGLVIFHHENCLVLPAAKKRLCFWFFYLCGTNA